MRCCPCGGAGHCREAERLWESRLAAEAACPHVHVDAHAYVCMLESVAKRLAAAEDEPVVIRGKRWLVPDVGNHSHPKSHS